ncbi:hypothetical protein ACX80E_10660 [Arthrobacter sp. TMN-49]
MADDEPWGRYERDKLPKGWAYPLGRDELSAALVSAGVRLSSLDFSRSDRIKSAHLYVMQVYWPSDAQANYFGLRDHESNPLTMSLRAVPSELRQEIGRQLRDGWLDEAIKWVKQAPSKGNAWTATEHWWNVIHKPDGTLMLEAH